MKKFYQKATAQEIEGGFGIFLDGRAVKTPAKALLVMPNKAVAEHVAAEWNAQEDVIKPDSMPMTQLVNTALDRVAPRRTEVMRELAAFGHTDLVCYRDGETPELHTLQKNGWDPVLETFASHVGVHLKTTEGIMPVTQVDDLDARLCSFMENYDALRLTILHSLTSGFGSIVLALLVFEDKLEFEGAWALSLIDQHFQENHWGLDGEVEEKRMKLHAELQTSMQLKGFLAS